MNTNKQRILIVSLLFLLMGSCAAYTAIDLPIRAPDQDEHMLEQSIERGALLYANNCRTCHGNSGEGLVGPKLNTDAWKNQDPVVLEENRRILTRTLQCGRAGTLMPAWLSSNGGSLNERQVQQMVDFLTAPYEEGVESEFGDPSNFGWEDALKYARNLNHSLSALVSGDTLPSIAAAHNIGIGLLAAENNIPLNQVNDVLKRGSKIRVPANSARPKGAEYQIRADNDTIAKLAATLNVGAAAIADLNGLAYELDYRSGTITLHDAARETLTGLLPGDKLKLPDGATYLVSANDTLKTIAGEHGVAVRDLRNLNKNLLADIADDDVLDGRRRLELPSRTTITLADETTINDLAELYSLAPAALASANGLTPSATLDPGQQIKIPDDARYVVQEGDTLDSIAQHHGIASADLAKRNSISDPATVTQFLVLALPKIDGYVVQGQTITDVALAYGGTSAAGFAEANGVAVDAILRIGTVLKLPEESTGTAPPNTINQGAACVRYAVPQSVYETIIGTAFNPETPPDVFAKTVVIQAHGNDWTVVADGVAMDPNKGIVKVRPDTKVTFENVEPVLHTVTVEGKTEEPKFGPAAGATFEFTFTGEKRYKITCDFHPDMLAYLFTAKE